MKGKRYEPGTDTCLPFVAGVSHPYLRMGRKMGRKTATDIMLISYRT